MPQTAPVPGHLPYPSTSTTATTTTITTCDNPTNPSHSILARGEPTCYALANGDTAQRSFANGDATPLRTLCTRLNVQITTFLHEDVKTERLKSAQAQTRISLQIIQEALDKYPYALPLPSYLPSFPFLNPC